MEISAALWAVRLGKDFTFFKTFFMKHSVDCLAGVEMRRNHLHPQLRNGFSVNNQHYCNWRAACVPDTTNYSVMQRTVTS